MRSDFQHFPSELLGRASLRGNEYAWNIADIPAVIEAAKAANLVNIGGQLQFRFPDGGTAECYWVQVDTFTSVEKHLSWSERVQRTAEAAYEAFSELSSRWDFAAEGREAFGQIFDAIERQGDDPRNFACFVWYVLNEQRAKAENF